MFSADLVNKDLYNEETIDVVENESVDFKAEWISIAISFGRNSALPAIQLRRLAEVKPTFFSKSTDFRKWLAKSHNNAGELLVGYYKISSGKPSLTWAESVDEALCYGWIDGVRKGIDAKSYTIRFSPRREGSFWSNKNIASAKRLIKTGRMKPTGLKAYRQRLGVKSGAYSFEQEEIAPFSAGLEKKFKANKHAWKFFNEQPPGYQKTMRHWVMTAKQEKTQLKRLLQLIKTSGEEKRIDLLSPFGKNRE